ncbi:MAG: amidase [Sheuella sp.]|nr:amidase [Sheuella sp.]
MKPLDMQDTVGAWVPHGRFSLPATSEGSLSGMTFAVKDLYHIAGIPTGAGNPTWLSTHDTPQHTSPLVEQLRAAGASVAGKVITDELAYSLNGDNIHYGTPTNVNAPGRVTGGSSSGSAAAVAARLVDFALASDTGGSTRVPASYCGIWGLRTTHGLLTTEHVVPLHPSFDTMNWFAHDADTFSRVAQVLLPATDFKALRVLKPAAVWALASEDFQQALTDVLNKAVKLIGSPAQEISFTNSDQTLEQWRLAYVAHGASEAWALHGDWITEHQPTFSAPIAGRWDAAKKVTPAQAQAAIQTTAMIRQQIRDMLADDAIVVMPSAAGLAPLLNATGADVDAMRTRTMHITCIGGISGVCQVSIPYRNAAGLPVGVSLMGPAGSDLALIALAKQISEMKE